MSDDLPTLPASWVWTTLGEVVGTSSGGTPRRAHQEYFGGEVPWLKIGDLNDGLVVSAEESITELGLANSSAERLPGGTLLVAMYGSIGKLGILDSEAATNQAICAIHTDDGVLRDYLFWYLLSKRLELLAAGFGGTQANISQTYLKKLPIPLTSREQQGRVVETLETFLERIGEGLASISEVTGPENGLPGLGAIEAKAVQLQHAVLGRAFAGTLTTPLSGDEPVSETLDRLRVERASWAASRRTRRSDRRRTNNPA